MLTKIKELARNKDLILRLALKDLKVRYKSPWLGFMWAILVPLFMMLIFTLIFSKFLGVRVGSYAFSLFLIAALFPWNFFSLSLSTATTNIVESGNLIKKVYFPREVIPVSVVAANLANFALALSILVPVFLFLQKGLPLLVFLLPVIILLHTIFVIGLSLIFSSLQVHYRDVKYIVEILLLGWFYVSPIIYPLHYVVEFISKRGLSPVYLNLYLLNPMAGFSILFRSALLKGYLAFLPSSIGYWRMFVQCGITSLLFLLAGFKIFEKLEKEFADLT